MSNCGHILALECRISPVLRIAGPFVALCRAILSVFIVARSKGFAMQSTTSSATSSRTVLISGAGVAGQALAYWLRRYGFEPTVVERSRSPRGGGFSIDLRGAAVDVAARMGILHSLCDRGVRFREIAHLDSAGDIVWKTDGNFGAGDGIAGDVEVLREDLNSIMHDATADAAEWIFGDSIRTFTDDDDGVIVDFTHGAQRRFDLVIGCDGLHSGVRTLAFGPEEQYIRPLGFYVAVFGIPNFLGLERQWFSCDMVGKQASILQYGAGKATRAVLLFASPRLDIDRRDAAAQAAVVAEAFAGETSWVVPQLLAAMAAADDLYFDEVSQIHMPSWSAGRACLVGDAAYAPTLITGQGTSLALVGSYVLAGELAAAGGDHQVAFARYHDIMRPFAVQNQAIAMGSEELAIPRTSAELDAKNSRLRQPVDTASATASDSVSTAFAEGSAAALMQNAANAISLPEYGAAV